MVNTTKRVDVAELGWKPVQGDFPLLLFETKNKMDTFCNHKGSLDCKDETICQKDMTMNQERCLVLKCVNTFQDFYIDKSRKRIRTLLPFYNGD